MFLSESIFKIPEPKDLYYTPKRKTSGPDFMRDVTPQCDSSNKKSVNEFSVLRYYIIDGRVNNSNREG